MAVQQDVITRKHPLRDLFIVFVAWKALIGLIAYCSPGIGYDTSSDLLTYSNTTEVQDVPSNTNHNLLKLVRWDAIYYIHISRHGHVFEQDWAFAEPVITSRIFGLGRNNSFVDHAMVGVLVSHLSHWFSVVLLYYLSNILHGSARISSSSISYVAAVLHIVSPAGIFLSAPYSESFFSFLSLLGFWLYARSVQSSINDSTASGLAYKLFSGVAFGCASMVRSNGIFGGLPFLVDAIETTFQLLNPRIDYFAKSHLLLQLQFTVIAGSCIAAGTLYPQYTAYREYCVGNVSARPWCKARLPSIYTFVQSHYWNVGFMRYWTLSNLPLFLLAIPCLSLLVVSGWHSVRPALRANVTAMQKLQLKIALPQLVLAMLALTNFHVQVITRLSSAYPMWYIWLAARVKDWEHSGMIVRVLTVYGLIQAGLFASFLPPA